MSEDQNFQETKQHSYFIFNMFDAISQVMYILAMKNSKLISTVFSAVAFFTLYSCGSTKIEPVPEIPAPVTEPKEPAVEEVPPVPEKKDEYEGLTISPSSEDIQFEMNSIKITNSWMNGYTDCL